jgi:hypothetical protein
MERYGEEKGMGEVAPTPSFQLERREGVGGDPKIGKEPQQTRLELDHSIHPNFDSLWIAVTVSE